MRKNNVLRGKPLNYPAGVASRYAAALKRHISAMTKETRLEYEKLFRPKPTYAMDATLAEQARVLAEMLLHKYTLFFDGIADKLARRIVEQTSDASKVSLGLSLREIAKDFTLDLDFFTPAVKEVMQASAIENVNLIKSLPTEYYTQVTGAVMRSITSGNGLADLVPFLRKQEGITKRRAELIAYDQTRKAYGALNVQRMRGAGVKKFEWLHSSGGLHPRHLHRRKAPAGLNGGIFDLDNPPVIDEKTGERGYCGQLINCRCRAIPVITFNE
jgi:SPP1 gp7 family putative phage head morphogenesis protein